MNAATSLMIFSFLSSGVIQVNLTCGGSFLWRSLIAEAKALTAFSLVWWRARFICPPIFTRLCQAFVLPFRTRGLGIEGVTLHSYRYAWAEREAICAYPERFAQLALGHTSRAVHQGYAKNATVPLPPLEEYERLNNKGKIIPLAAQKEYLGNSTVAETNNGRS